ncbi:hypothetical protein NCAS_0A10110 [Naumovozyma castellii]|uniref:HMG box domain-containing protein n=1 Tax=Naumovozyma castellii TaxID=27288 RepID=G0V7X1_NAUCA|nr:hypothetical protein NCAS_0A10110 [Naumovozyma castellii CBS 4309]CCC67569.1 hypothetical protein NCAS_0A10110 [Naumovozyma castellii CBS 4309]
MTDLTLTEKIETLKRENEALGLTVTRTRQSVKRLKLEYATLLERLQSRIELDPQLSPEGPLPTLESYKDQLLVEPMKKSRTAAAKKRRNRNKVNKLRDPNLPKRPTNAYLIFCELNKEDVRAKGSTDVTKDLSEMWKALDDEARKPYFDLYNEDRERYRSEMDVYNKNLVAAKEVLAPRGIVSTAPSTSTSPPSVAPGAIIPATAGIEDEDEDEDADVDVDADADADADDDDEEIDHHEEDDDEEEEEEEEEEVEGDEEDEDDEEDDDDDVVKIHSMENGGDTSHIEDESSAPPSET